MPKLTPAQKEANKAERKVRDTAYAARRKLYDAARAQDHDDHLASPEHSARLKVNQDIQTAREERNRAQAALREQIEAMQAKIEDLDEVCNERVKPLEIERANAMLAESKSQAERESALQAKYPDMVGVWSVLAWKPELIPKTS